MRALVVATILSFAIMGSACGDDDDSSAADTTAAETLDIDIPDVVGESVEDATLEDAGLTLRVVRSDGEDLGATMDFVETRVNVAVETQDDGTETVTEVVSTG